MNVYFAKGTACVTAPSDAVARYGRPRASVCVFADADGHPFEGWEAVQEGPLVRVLLLSGRDLARLWTEFQRRPTLPPRPDREWPFVKEPPYFERHATHEEAEALCPGLVAEIKAYNAAVHGYSEWRKRATRGDAAYESVMDAFAEGIQPLGKTQTDMVFGVRG